ncbi:TPA: response regulator [Candidatus Saccharibacteria bacterium]|nr:response regulator [Candidatus Saccharibacteria bacterium]HIO87488.1 response regulator [Candidatus Saccharibacteria bacterium]
MKRILMIEDFPVLHKIYGDYLERHGEYKVETVTDVDQALELLQNIEFDFILLDLLLPKINGIQFLEQFDKPEKTKVIVLSDFNKPETVSEAINLGVADFLIKAENTPSQLLEKLNSYQ